MRLSRKILKRKSILIIDDEADIRKIIAYEMKSYEMQVYEAENGMEAFELAVKNQIDIVLSDLRMLDGDDLMFLEKIKLCNTNNPAIILMTGFADLKKEDIRKMGVTTLLKKPLDWERLAQIIEDSLLGKQIIAFPSVK